MIHPTAVVSKKSKIASSVTIGPYAVVEENVEIDEGCIIGSHTVITGPTSIGKNNKIFQFCSIGDDPQDKKFEGEDDSILMIGDNNTIREYCSINRGTGDGGGKTVVGDHNWIMAYVHIAHDCIVGNNTTFANNATLAGHVTIDDYVILGGFTGVHQFCHIGAYSFAAISSVVTKDIPPFLMVSGNTAKPSGLNREGLKRHGFSSEQLDHLKRAYKVLYREGNTLLEAIEKLQAMSTNSESIALLLEFVKGSTRGLAR